MRRLFEPGRARTGSAYRRRETIGSAMIESDAFVQALQDIGVDFFTGVPDSILGGIIAELMVRRIYTPAEIGRAHV